MKKIVSFLFMLLLSLGFTNGNAQNQAVKKTAATNTQNAAVPLKKDGTPDKRYKENKSGATTTKHLKKDGTPDKRYKENK